MATDEDLSYPGFSEGKMYRSSQKFSSPGTAGRRRFDAASSAASLRKSRDPHASLRPMSSYGLTSGSRPTKGPRRRKAKDKKGRKRKGSKRNLWKSKHRGESSLGRGQQLRSLRTDENRPTGKRRPRESAIQSKIEGLKQSLRKMEATQGSLLTRIEKRTARKGKKTRQRSTAAPYSYSAYKERRAAQELEEVERLRRLAQDEIFERERQQRQWDERDALLQDERARRDRDEFELRRSIERAEHQRMEMLLDEERQMAEQASSVKQAHLRDEQIRLDADKRRLTGMAEEERRDLFVAQNASPFLPTSNSVSPVRSPQFSMEPNSSNPLPNRLDMTRYQKLFSLLSTARATAE